MDKTFDTENCERDKRNYTKSTNKYWSDIIFKQRAVKKAKISEDMSDKSVPGMLQQNHCRLLFKRSKSLSLFFNFIEMSCPPMKRQTIICISDF
jgi:hypothetical protein